MASAATKPVETYTLKVDAKWQAIYAQQKGAYMLHYMFGPDGKIKGIFNGGVTARRWIKRNAGTPEGILGAIQFEAGLEKPYQG